MMLEDLDSPEMHVIEVDENLLIRTCNNYQYNYTIITKDDLVIPPEHYDYV